MFPGSAYMVLLHANFMIDVLGVSQSGARRIEDARKLSPSLLVRFMMFVRQQQATVSGQMLSRIRALMHTVIVPGPYVKARWRCLIAFRPLPHAFAAKGGGQSRQRRRKHGPAWVSGWCVRAYRFVPLYLIRGYSSVATFAYLVHSPPLPQ